ncbi:segregation/condensation protein A [Heyndrickxia sporothermodurans]|uniref:Segregation and condensation protein A n=2 Tax=Heyndrickxia sporothermodurans TaxID=46224 RepID=A0AB37H950_9BACI|nr:segregation/condensation protein A [Heyndrickxia sporothermodurans]MBL5771935.1 segregation/condensation protein A [Heyndrickxia sporothermodurans]MBL5775551.1 segregation/condensation protein A [Heyndrickxia sporothermodurans]MBL5779266.1 segregation/condensation protein A [Heyndrickxia sporothermodurans]MBL5782641.1 segregation/condensation protein A [Heyndrickxia sporothermodurans]
MMEYNVKIDAFEGPLDLLLHLINRLEIDIYDIPMAEISEQYLLFIHAMKELELDVASEYLVMAATLLAIKSKMLLPKYEDELEDEFEYEEDPRDDLVEKLVEYRKYKEAAIELKQMEQERGQMFTKPPSDLTEYMKDIPSDQFQGDVSIYDMIGALNKLLRRKKLQKPLSTKITRQEISIESRMEEILKDLTIEKGKQNFNTLFPVPEKNHVVITFLAILELMKRNEIYVEQDGNFEDIFVARKGASMIGTN